MKTYEKLICFLTILTLSCCIQGGFDDYTCDRIIRVEFEWIETDPKIDLDFVDVVFISPNGTIHQVQSQKEGREIELDENKYEAVAWESAENVIMSGNTVTIEKEAGGMAKEPEEFNAGSTFVEIDDDDPSPVLVIPLLQQTRPLIIQVRFEGCADRVTEVNGVVDGIAESRHVNYAFFATDANPRYPALSSCSIRYNFEPDEEGWYTDQKVLLGISGEEEQNLKLDVKLIDDSHLAFDIPITDKLDRFYVEDVKKPWVIQITLSIGCGGSDGDEITIVDWIAGPKSIIIVS